MKVCAFPGSFDPFHKGHEFVVIQALKEFDFVYIIISWNPFKKNRRFSFEHIKNKIETTFNNNRQIKVIINENNLMPNLLKELDCLNVIRGYRNLKDRIYEARLKREYLKLNKNLKFKYYKSSKELKNERSSLFW